MALLGLGLLPASGLDAGPQRVLLVCLDDQMPPLRSIAELPADPAQRGAAALLLAQPALGDGDLTRLLELLGWAQPRFSLAALTRGQVAADPVARRALLGQSWLRTAAAEWLGANRNAELEVQCLSPRDWRATVENLRQPPPGYAAIVFQAGDTWWRWLKDDLASPEPGLAVRWFDDLRLLVANRGALGAATVEGAPDLPQCLTPAHPLGYAIDPSINRLWEFVGLLGRAGQTQILSATHAEVASRQATAVVDHLVALRRGGLLRTFPTTEALYDALVAGEVAACVAEPRVVYWLEQRYGNGWNERYRFDWPYRLTADAKPRCAFLGGHLLVTHPNVVPDAVPLARDLIRTLAGPEAPAATAPATARKPHFPPYARQLRAAYSQVNLGDAEVITPAGAASSRLALVEDNPVVTDRYSRLWFNISRVPVTADNEPPAVTEFAAQLRADALADLAAAQSAADAQLGAGWAWWAVRLLEVVVLLLIMVALLLAADARRRRRDLRLALAVLVATQGGTRKGQRNGNQNGR
ncbi:MAG: hypothetical protein IT204_26075 [Fimbriimonadaceae bacterium]|nr:hypothetical protein [Fimbriimonadaceae bacterium]